MNQCALKPTMYHFHIRTYPKYIKKKIKKVLDNPLTVWHNEYVERVNIKGYDEWLKLLTKR